jgi:hypothetical protein
MSTGVCGESPIAPAFFPATFLNQMSTMEELAHIGENHLDFEIWRQSWPAADTESSPHSGEEYGLTSQVEASPPA